MAVAKLECPECGTVLRPSKPLSPGKKVRCPKCETTFTVPDEEERPATRKAGAAKAVPAAKKAAPAKPRPAPPAQKKPVDDDEEDGGVAYGLAKEPGEEDDERKPKIEYVPDLKVKDPRGPAVAALAKPSNYLMLFGALLCVLSLLSLGVATWPFMFTKYGSGVFPSDVKREWAKRHPQPGQEKKKNSEEEESSWPDQDAIMKEIRDEKSGAMFKLWEEMSSEDQNTRIIWGICSVIAGALAAVLASSAVKMQNLESYRWSITACVMGLVCGIVTAVAAGVVGKEASEGDDLMSMLLWAATAKLGSFTGAVITFSVWGFIVLRRPEIIEAFEYNPE